MKKIDLIRRVDEACSLHQFWDLNGALYRRIYRFWDGDKVGVFIYVDEGLEFTDEMRAEMDKMAHEFHHQPYKSKYIWGHRKPLPVGNVKVCRWYLRKDEE